MSLTLTDRMLVIAELCSKRNSNNDILFDVGCDHALISIDLLKNDIFARAVASDINKGPLKSAGVNARKAGVSEKMEFILSDGLKDIDVAQKKDGYEGAVLVISGMGGELTEKILSESYEKLEYFDEFIFSPQSKLNGFRRFLGKRGFCIREEKTVLDKGKYYFVIRASKGADACHNETDYELGPYFFSDKSDIKKELLKNRISLYEGLCRNDRIDSESLKRYNGLLGLYREALTRYEMP